MKTSCSSVTLSFIYLSCMPRNLSSFHRSSILNIASRNFFNFSMSFALVPAVTRSSTQLRTNSFRSFSTIEKRQKSFLFLLRFGCMSNVATLSYQFLAAFLDRSLTFSICKQVFFSFCSAFQRPVAVPGRVLLLFSDVSMLTSPRFV